MIRLKNRGRPVAVVSFAVMLVFGWFAYAPAFSGSFLLDDFSNLGGLQHIEDRISALQFVFSGSAGPLGRPLALVTFLPQASAWESGARSFLKVNVLIHLVNACLLAFFSHRLSVSRQIEDSKALFIAIAAALVWAFMPLLASASLMAVQRMTTLSATFVLLGLLGYLYARTSIERATNRSLIGMSMALTLGTILAVFTKESGALLPTYVLILEATVLARPAIVSPAKWRTWIAVFLVLPTAAILAYLIWHVPYSEELVLRRDFTAWQRLLTESRILWEYLFNAFIPQPGQFGPFHDAYPVARSVLNPLTLLAFSGWLLILIFSVLWRRRYPLFAFAVLWFIGGHMIESTTLPLELYFEHRNYLPIVGFVYALCSLVLLVPEQHKKVAYTTVPLYILINAYFLVSFTSLWGNPVVSAAYWREQYPDSVRAATTYATQQLAQNGPLRTIQVLDDIVEETPKAGYVKIQALNLSCLIAPDADHRETVDELESLLADVSFTYTAGTMLSQLFTTVSRIECQGVDGNDVKELAMALLGNPRYKNDAAYNQLHHQLMARIHRYNREFEDTIGHLEKAIQHRRTPELNMMMVTTLADGEQFDAARGYIQDARAQGPLHPVKRYLWQQDLNNLDSYVDELEQYADKQGTSTSKTEPDTKLP